MMLKRRPVRISSFFQKRHYVRQRVVDQAIIFPDSLDETLESHRKANRALVIRKIEVGNRNDTSKERPVESQSSKQRPRSGYVTTTESDPITKQEVEGKKTSWRTAVSPVVPFELRTVNFRYLAKPRPWLADHIDNKSTRLSVEILQFAHHMRLTDIELAVRKYVCQQVVRDLQDGVPDIEFELFGSQTTGVASTMSDIDIAFKRYSDPDKSHIKKSRTKNLYEIRKCLSHFATKYRASVIQARYPLVRVKHLPSGLDIQVVHGEKMIASHEYVKSYTEEFPSLWPVYILIKTALEARRLTGPEIGGIGSYTLFMWITACFKHKNISRHDGIASVLMQVLEFCGGLDTSACGISVEPAVLFKKSLQVEQDSLMLKEAPEKDLEQYWHTRLGKVRPELPNALCLQDPANMSNDLGRLTYKIMDIRETLMTLKNTLSAWLQSSQYNYLDRRDIKSPLDIFVGWQMNVIQNKRIVIHQFYEQLSADERQHNSSTQPIELKVHAQDTGKRLLASTATLGPPKAPIVVNHGKYVGAEVFHGLTGNQTDDVQTHARLIK